MNKVNKLPFENDCGCAEYKIKLDSNYLSKNSKRFEKLKTQLLFRINEGGSYCIYFLGVKNNGSIANISFEEINNSESVLFKLINSLNLKLIIRTHINFDSNARSYIICK